MATKTYKVCQSCGMPLDKDPNGGGTERSIKKKSKKYCSMCYQGGRFTFHGNVDQFKAMMKKRILKQGTGKIRTWIYLLQISQLERWRKEKQKLKENATKKK